ncbi:MAG: ABC transporter ATP-binding protein [Bifidobacteriaceae bacterium]|jgi:ABC-2 type transport system ATP-binding protein|nr:ABC transporter ATP-binding protein [Bifidobacteriaceae bacterium]MCI1914122.1 ABC transporter ATP-binding protein [Bifidobacteriaceae bacterium]MCI1936378.1 ABC transporter ATP-binding protein [Bifidobacteriaceae bacterium]
MTLKISHLTKRYKEKQALNNVSLTFEPSTIYALLGNNGAGKSTLLNIINNRIFTTEGEVELDGEPVIDNSPALRHLYLMSEDNLFPPSMKVSTIFTMTEGFFGGFDWDLANHLINGFELQTSLSFKKLSTGYRTITKLIAALCVPANYIFLDEPVLGLDATHREFFYRELIQTFSDRPRCFVISTHLIEEISHLVESVVIIDDGVILEQGDAESMERSAFSVEGSPDLAEEFTANLDVLSSNRITGQMTVYVKGTVPPDVPAGLRIEYLGLQDYFVRLAQAHKFGQNPSLRTMDSDFTDDSHDSHNSTEVAR